MSTPLLVPLPRAVLVSRGSGLPPAHAGGQHGQPGAACPGAGLRRALRQPAMGAGGYLLGITSLTVVAGRLGDRLGRRRLPLWGPGSCAGFLLRPWPLPSAGSLQPHPAGGCGLHAGARWPWQERCRRPTGLEHGIARHPVGLRHGARPSFGGLLIGGFGWQAPFLLLLPGVAGAGVPGGSALDEAARRGSLPLTSLLLLVTALLCYPGTDPGQPASEPGRG